MTSIYTLTGLNFDLLYPICSNSQKFVCSRTGGARRITGIGFEAESRDWVGGQEAC